MFYQMFPQECPRGAGAAKPDHARTLGLLGLFANSEHRECFVWTKLRERLFAGQLYYLHVFVISACGLVFLYRGHRGIRAHFLGIE